MYATYDANGNITGYYLDTSSIPAGANYIYLTSEQYQEALNNPGMYTIQNGVFTGPTAAQLLAQAQGQQANVVNQGYYQAISSGVTSSASGTSYKYSTDSTTIGIISQNINIHAYLVSVSPTWIANTAVTLNQMISVGGSLYVCSTPGTSGLAIPTLTSATPSISVTDGTAQWKLWSAPIQIKDGSVNPAYIQHSLNSLQLLSLDIRNFLDKNNLQYYNLVQQIYQATTISAVQAIVWVNPV